MDSNTSTTRTMRQSLASSWDICGRRAWYDTQPHLYSASYESAIGTGYHRGLQVHYGAIMDGNTAPLEVVQAEAIRAFTEEIDKSEDRFQWGDGNWDLGAVDIIQMLDAYIKGDHWAADRYTVLGVEVSFDLPWLADTPRHGTIDMAVLDRFQDLVYLIDHKTTGRRWPQSKNDHIALPQAPWYMDAWEQMHGVSPAGFIFDVMIRPKRELDRRTLMRNPTQQALALTRIVGISKAMDALDAAGVPWPANPSSVLCSEKYCRHWNQCPYGAASKEGQTP